MFEEFLEKLKIEIKGDLPGAEAHRLMIPKMREYKVENDNYTESAVNIVLYPNGSAPNFILTKRSNKLAKHSGQISLPGGKKDKKDKDLWETCKRETKEETTIIVRDSNYIGKLSKLLIPLTRFSVQPFVSFINYKPILPEKTKEVQKFIETNINSIDTLNPHVFS